MMGIIIMILAWVGSAGCGLRRNCKSIVAPMISGQTPMARNVGGSNGNRPNKLKNEVGSGAERSKIHP